MIFNSVTYLLFLPLVVVAYWLLPRRPRLWLLFIASLVFYGFWRVEFLPVMLVSVLTDYFAALGIDRTSRPRYRRLLLLLSLTVNLGLLAYFKYLAFFAENISGLMGLLGVELMIPLLDIILPLGISFYTFQTISYTIDVYRGFVKPESDFVLFSCYVMFFPQLVAGPILRAREVVSQLSDRPSFDPEDLASGLRRILLGMFLKVVLADNIAPLVDSAFAQDVSTLSAIDVLTMSFAFGFQIYFDFSAYSHIAIGSARLMGIHFPENFDFPYLASSPRAFWLRWHISLSSWIRDYLYLPLVGARVHDRSTGGLAEATVGKSLRALFLTWAIMGLWHGANWTFVFWGLYHAAFIALYRLSKPVRQRLPEAVRRLGGWVVTLAVAMLSWIPFRAKDLGHSLQLFGRLLEPRAYTWLGLRENTYLVTAILLVAMIGFYQFGSRVVPRMRRFELGWALMETAALASVITLIWVFLRPIRQFIYFQF